MARRRQEKAIRMIDFKMTDIDGRWRHITIPVERFDENVFVYGKVDPVWRDFWRQTYDAVIPGYHLNKQHWNTVILDGT